ncbi:MAG: glycerol-3-phosphate acyltransferase, partial [Chloroflexota bacterium]
LLFMAIGYLSGSVLYARLIATHVLKIDLATVGDGNPGTSNVGKAGGPGWAVAVFVMDVLKAAIPTYIAYVGFGLNDWRLPFIAIMPAIGHAYPIFFGFKGGKGIAAIAGGWVGIALWEIITVGGLMLGLWYVSVRESAWVTMFMSLSVGLYLVLVRAPQFWFGYWVLGMIFLVWTHRRELPNPPGVQPWVVRVAQLWHR